MTRGKPPAPAKAKGKRGGHPVLRALLAVAVLGAFVLLVLPSDWFGEWITEPRSTAAVVGGAVAFFLLWLLVGRLAGAKSSGAFYAVVALAVTAGGVLYVQDAGSAAVRAGVLDCPKPDKGTRRVAAPSGRQCVEVPACKVGGVPQWKAGGDVPTGKCVAKPRRRG